MLDSRTINHPIKNWAQELKRNFSKENIQMANKYMERCSTSLILREMQIKTTVRYHFTPVRPAAIKRSTNNNCWRGCGEKGNLLHCWWNANCYSHYGEECGDSLKNWKSNCHTTHQSTAGHTHWGNQNWKRHVDPSGHRSTVYNSQDIKAT